MQIALATDNGDEGFFLVGIRRADPSVQRPAKRARAKGAALAYPMQQPVVALATQQSAGPMDHGASLPAIPPATGRVAQPVEAAPSVSDPPSLSNVASALGMGAHT